MAPRLRTGGYVIDFWGRGFDVAEKMGLLSDIKSQGYNITVLSTPRGDEPGDSTWPKSFALQPVVAM